LRLLQESQRPELDFRRLEALILQDVSLSYQMLRYVNSPLFPVTSNVRSIRQALVFLGDVELRRWVVLATLARTAEDKPSELTRHSLVRARFCESVARLAKNGLEQSAFLAGLFSLLDALIDRPLGETLSAMSLAPEIAAVLTGEANDSNPLAVVYELAQAYEAADWQRVEAIARQLGVPIASLGEVYCAAAGWAQQVLDPVAAQPV
jgi:EAL and modified HD-GYP domain-containing signal transduction protein